MKYLLSTAAVALAMATTGMPAAAQQQADCSNTFKAVDANNDGKVSKQEANAAVTNEFNTIDSDGDGSISQSEWQNCGTQIHTMMDTKRSNMQASDHAPMQNQQSDQQAGQQQTGQQQAKKGQQGQQSGSQGTATTGQSASTATLKEEGPPRPWTTDEQFSQADTDKSGDVSREEAAKATEKNYSKSGSQEARAQQARASGARFAMIDSNGDGSISQQEWKNRDQADVEAFFARLDEDNNDKLSKSEYQQVRLGQGQDEPVSVWYYYYVY